MSNKRRNVSLFAKKMQDPRFFADLRELTVQLDRQESALKDYRDAVQFYAIRAQRAQAKGDERLYETELNNVARMQGCVDRAQARAATMRLRYSHMIESVVGTAEP